MLVKKLYINVSYSFYGVIIIGIYIGIISIGIIIGIIGIIIGYEKINSYN